MLHSKHQINLICILIVNFFFFILNTMKKILVFENYIVGMISALPFKYPSE